MNTGSLLQVTDLHVEIASRRGIVRAVDGVSLEVPAGQAVGVVGESGSGKSMTLRAILGVLPPEARITAGQVLLDGQDLAHLSNTQLNHVRGPKIAMIFQEPMSALNPVMRVGAQIAEGPQVHLGMNRAKAGERALELMRRVGIPDPERRYRAYPHEFSGGMRQRVVIALALCAEPELIIADEPTTALDVSVQAQIIALIKRLGRDHGTAVMLVTHDMGVIAETCDRVAVMYSGRIAEIGPVQAVIRNPLHPYARGLMGAIPTLSGEAHRLIQIPGAMPRLSAIPPGCPFNPRCAQVFERCQVERPEPIRKDAQAVACHLFDVTESAA